MKIYGRGIGTISRESSCPPGMIPDRNDKCVPSKIDAEMWKELLKETGVSCAQVLKECPDGSFVGYDPSQKGCVYLPCSSDKVPNQRHESSLLAGADYLDLVLYSAIAGFAGYKIKGATGMIIGGVLGAVGYLFLGKSGSLTRIMYTGRSK